eukprot:GAFH01001595.1.p2 GENE.GAFH01001595.1~~GAFH01001595.1.p2  ORF type:complete len:418 (-),score=109.21 GAFH01001595.1:277-1368(-)
MAAQNDFEVKAFKQHGVIPEQTRAPRIVRVGAIQNKIPVQPDAPIQEQLRALHERMAVLIQAAAGMGVNVVCLQEGWNIPFFMCTRERYPWCEMAESATNGPTVLFLQELARTYNMVIISPILERDEVHMNQIKNTAVVISNNGGIIGKHSKNHIPRVGDFNEASYYVEGTDGHPVFETAFGKIGIAICYGRHHPLNWQAFALNGAEMIFNPSATVAGLSEPLWGIEARNAAIANSVYTIGVNRVGCETYPNAFTSGNGTPAHKDFGWFFGSSYLAAPNGSRTPGLSRTHDGVLCTEIDLNLCRQCQDIWSFPMTGRHEMYAKLLTAYCRDDFVPQTVRDPSLPVAGRQQPQPAQAQASPVCK